MTDQPKRIAILGPGVLGGSLALALQTYHEGVVVSLWGRRPEFVAEAHKQGIENATSDLAEALVGVDVIILATPVGVMAELLEQALTHLEAGSSCLITDLGSVKVAPDQAIRSLLKGTKHRFVGCHPMAGSEKTGIEAASAELFKEAACLLTPRSEDSSVDVAYLEELWRRVGGRVASLSAEDHDRAVARISHFPHLLASLCADIAMKDSELACLGGGGLRDTSRVASGDAAMWTEILLENREALKVPIEEAINQLREVLASIENSDHHQLQDFLQRAKDKRDAL